MWRLSIRHTEKMVQHSHCPVMTTIGIIRLQWHLWQSIIIESHLNIKSQVLLSMLTQNFMLRGKQGYWLWPTADEGSLGIWKGWHTTLMVLWCVMTTIGLIRLEEHLAINQYYWELYQIPTSSYADLEGHAEGGARAIDLDLQLLKAHWAYERDDATLLWPCDDHTRSHQT